MLEDPYESPTEVASEPPPSILATELSWKWVCLVALSICLLSYAATLALAKRTYLPPWISNTMWDRLHMVATSVFSLSFCATIATGFAWMVELAKKAIGKQRP